VCRGVCNHLRGKTLWGAVVRVQGGRGVAQGDASTDCVSLFTVFRNLNNTSQVRTCARKTPRVQAVSVLCVCPCAIKSVWLCALSGARLCNKSHPLKMLDIDNSEIDSMTKSIVASSITRTYENSLGSTSPLRDSVKSTHKKVIEGRHSGENVHTLGCVPWCHK
jgi:hypothetical protein